MPIGMPGWPLFAFSTASIESARMALAIGARRTLSRLMQTCSGYGADDSNAALLGEGNDASSAPVPAWLRGFGQTTRAHDAYAPCALAIAVQSCSPPG